MKAKVFRDRLGFFKHDIEEDDKDEIRNYGRDVNPDYRRMPRPDTR